MSEPIPPQIPPNSADEDRKFRKLPRLSGEKEKFEIPKTPNFELVPLLFHPLDPEEWRDLRPIRHLVYTRNIGPETSPRLEISIPKFVFEEAYKRYAERYPSSARTQSAETLQNRGGFGVIEITGFFSPKEIEELYEKHLNK